MTTQSGAVASVQVQANALSVDEIEANSATFSNIFVTNSATFSTTLVDASVVEADTGLFTSASIGADGLTVGGYTVDEIVQAKIEQTMVSEIRSLSVAESDKIASEYAIRSAIDATSLVWVNAQGVPLS